jgi:hypothetical protein
MPPGSVSPCAGRSLQLVFRKETTMSRPAHLPLTLSDRLRRQWQQAALLCQPSRPGVLDDLLGPSSELARQFLPQKCLRELEAAVNPRGKGLCVINNLPIDPELGPAPTDGRRPKTKTTYVSEMALLGSTRSIGYELVTFQQEKRGEWPQQVAPVIGLEKTNSSASREEFGAHADNAIFPRWVRLSIALIGLVNERRTETYFAPLDDILEALPPATVELLRLPLYRFRFPESFAMDRDISRIQPVLARGPHGQDEIKFTVYSVEGTTPEAAEAVQALRNVLPGLMQSVVIDPGTLVLFNNARCLHARGRIEGARWAQRIYLAAPHTFSNLQTVTGTGPMNRVFDARLLVGAE